jgi:hypothetical protein
MKRLFAAMTAALMVLAFAGAAVAAPPTGHTGKNGIVCFGDPLSCQIVSKTSARLDTTQGTGGGIYIPGFNNSFYGVRTSLITNLSNTVTGDPLGIDPRWSIPIDDTTYDFDGDGDGISGPGYTDYFLFAAFGTCNDGAGLVDVLNDPTCTLVNSISGETFPNWATFVSVHENTNIAALDNFAFIIADHSGAPGVWTISNVKIGKPGR